MGLRAAMFLLTGLGLAAAIAPAIGAEEVVEQFDTIETARTGPLGERLLLGTEDPWTGEIKEGTYFLINREGPGAVRVITLDSPASSSKIRGVAADVFGQFEGEHAGAGVAYGWDAGGQSGYAFLVQPSNGYAVYRVTGAGLEEISKGTNQAIKAAAVNRVAVAIEGDDARLMVNDALVFVHELPDAELSGGIGIVAADVGAYSFDDLAVATD